MRDVSGLVLSSSSSNKENVESEQMILVKNAIEKSIDWQEAIEKINKEFPDISEKIVDELIQECFF